MKYLLKSKWSNAMPRLKSKWSRVMSRPLFLLLPLFGLLFCSFADLGGARAETVELVLATILFILAFAGFGVGLGSFGFLANHLFRKRSAVTFKVLCAKPFLSLVMGVIITIVGLGLIAMVGHMPRVQFLLMLSYLIGLCTFSGGASLRVVARHMEPVALEDELPGAWSHIKAGLVLLFANAVILLGTIFFLGILLAGVGAALLGYFISMGNATAATMQTMDKEREEPVRPVPPLEG